MIKTNNKNTIMSEQFQNTIEKVIQNNFRLKQRQNTINWAYQHEII